jgi:hypothetical protein
MPALCDGNGDFPQDSLRGSLVRRTALLDSNRAHGARQQTIALSQLDELGARAVGLALRLRAAA